MTLETATPAGGSAGVDSTNVQERSTQLAPAQDPFTVALGELACTSYPGIALTLGTPSTVLDELSKVHPVKDSAPAWGPHVLLSERPSRAAANVAGVTALALDVDHATTAQLESAIGAVATRGLGALLVSTHSHAPPVHCYRVVLGLSRPVGPDEWSAFWWQSLAWLGLLDLVGKKNEPGKCLDVACSDVSHAFFVPPPSAEVALLPGALLPVDVIRVTPVPTRARQARTNAARTTVLSHDDLRRTAKAWTTTSRSAQKQLLGGRLLRVCDGLPAAEPGERDTILFDLARALVRTFPALDPVATAAVFEPSIDAMRRVDPTLPPSIMRDKLERAINYVPERTQGLDLHVRTAPTGEVTIATDLHNLTTILEQHPTWHGRLAWNELTCRTIDQQRGAWEDHHTTELCAWLADEFGFDALPNKVDRAVEAIARKQAQHPIRNYLNGLRWDGVPRCHTLFTRYFGAADEPLVRAFGLRWMIGAVARVMQPGCQNDCTPVVQGAQGIRKSSGFRALCADPSWFSDTRLQLDNPTRLAEQLIGIWIYELAELSALRGRDVELTKACLTSRVDHAHLPYGHRAVDLPRQVCFVGSTNADTYLQDETGGRRFWPVRAGERVDVDAIARERDQLWAEAAARFTAGKQWHLTPEEEIPAHAAQEGVRDVDSWEDVLAAWRPADPPEACGGYRIEVIAQGALQRAVGAFSLADGHRIGRCLRALGWKQIRAPKIAGQSRPRLWFPPKDR